MCILPDWLKKKKKSASESSDAVQIPKKSEKTQMPEFCDWIPSNLIVIWSDASKIYFLPVQWIKLLFQIFGCEESTKNNRIIKYCLVWFLVVFNIASSKFWCICSVGDNFITLKMYHYSLVVTRFESKFS